MDTAQYPPTRVNGRLDVKSLRPPSDRCRHIWSERECQARPGEQNVKHNPQQPGQISDHSNSFQRTADKGYFSVGKTEKIRHPHQEQDEISA